MTTPCRIRPAAPAEAAALSALCLRSKAAWGYDAAFLARARALLEVPPAMIIAGDVWVAEEGGGVRGVVALGPGAVQGERELALLFVAPERMRHGIGLALLRHAAAEAARRGATALTILSDPHAAGFYARAGATPAGEAPSDAIPGQMLPLYRLMPASIHAGRHEALAGAPMPAAEAGASAAGISPEAAPAPAR